MTGTRPRDPRDERAAIDAYLLDRLAGAERAAVEDRFFEDEAFSAQMLDRDHDLIDALAVGALPADEARALTARLAATPEGRDRLRLARALQSRQRSRLAEAADARVPASVEPRSQAWWQVAAVAALAAGAAWLAIDDVRLRERLGDLDARSSPAPEVRIDPEPPEVPGTVRVVLSAIRTRGRDEVPTVAVPSRATAVHLVLPSGDGTERFDARVETSPGAELVAQQFNLRRNASGEIDVWVGVSQLPDGDYEVLLSSAGNTASGLVGQYAFRVRRGAASSP